MRGSGRSVRQRRHSGAPQCAQYRFDGEHAGRAGTAASGSDAIPPVGDFHPVLRHSGSWRFITTVIPNSHHQIHVRRPRSRWPGIVCLPLSSCWVESNQNSASALECRHPDLLAGAARKSIGHGAGYESRPFPDTPYRAVRPRSLAHPRFRCRAAQARLGADTRTLVGDAREGDSIEHEWTAVRMGNGV